MSEMNFPTNPWNGQQWLNWEWSAEQGRWKLIQGANVTTVNGMSGDVFIDTADMDHDHDELYAPLNHEHDGYAAVDHDHEEYALADHGHDVKDIEGLEAWQEGIEDDLAVIQGDLIFAGGYDPTTNQLARVTTRAEELGFESGMDLPTPSEPLRGMYVIINKDGGTYHGEVLSRGDWIICDGTSWVPLNYVNSDFANIPAGQNAGEMLWWDDVSGLWLPHPIIYTDETGRFHSHTLEMNGKVPHITLDSDADDTDPSYIEFLGGNAEPAFIARAIKDGNFVNIARAGDLVLDVAKGQKILFADGPGTPIAHFEDAGAAFYGNVVIGNESSTSQLVVNKGIITAKEGVYEDINVSDKFTVGAVTYPKAHGQQGQVLHTGGSGELYWKFADDLIEDDPIFKAHPTYKITQSDIDKWNSGTGDGGGTAGVSSFNGRDGAVSLTRGDVTSVFSESDPTVPSHVKSITQTDINNWNNAVGGGDVDLTNYYTKAQVDSGFAAANHTHTQYAAANHTHNYAAANHSHSEYQPKGNYADANHTHSGYAASNHTHSGYAASNHTHDYAASSHTHAFSSISGGTSAGTAEFTFNSGVTAKKGIDVAGGAFTVNAYISCNGYIYSGTDLRAGGDVIAYYSSDERLKDNIRPIEGALAKLLTLRGVEFEWNDKQDRYTGTDVGVVAQDIETVFPSLVNEQSNGFLGVRYEKLAGPIIAAVAELADEVRKLKAEVKELKGA